MCNRHLADAIAEYEASRLDENGELEDGESGPEGTEHAGGDEVGIITAVRARLAR